MSTRTGKVLRLLLGLLGGCNGGAYPWEGGGPPPSASPFATERPQSAATVATSSADPAVPETPHGGLFEQCARGLLPESDPVVDVSRLFAVCGPPTGMGAGTEAPLEGAISEGRAPVTLTFATESGRCYRLFAVGDPGVSELDVEVRSPSGILLASDHAEGRVSIVQPDRPICTSGSGEVAILVSARRGAGAFALEVGVL